MPIKFSDHALEQLKRRNISMQHVIEVIRDPEEKSSSYKERSLRRKVINDKMLEVITITEGSKITVITAYYLDK